MYWGKEAVFSWVKELERHVWPGSEDEGMRSIPNSKEQPETLGMEG